jgi:DNA-binding NarL/FixJ family response regulator
MKRRIRVLVVDDHEIVRQGLLRMLDREQDIRVVGVCAAAEEAFADLESLVPDIIVMDSQMPGTDGIQATGRLKRNGLSYDGDVIVLAESSDHMTEAMEAGASAYLLKDIGRDELAQAIRQVYQKAQATRQDGLVELVELVISPSVSLAQSVRFTAEVEKALEACVVAAVGSPVGGSAITITLTPSPLESIVSRLQSLADVEAVEERKPPKDVFGFLRKFRVWSKVGSSRPKRLLVDLRLA